MALPPSVLVSAGEVSGDRFAAPVALELRRRRPELRLFGAGGPALSIAGVEVRHSLSDLAVTGLTEAAGRLPRGLWTALDLTVQARRRRPRLAILVDYPGLNLRLAARLTSQGTPVLYFIAPQRWAWLAWRTAALRARVDRLAVTLPFEERWFRQRGVAARFVGHPLLDLFRPRPRAEARLELGAGGGALVALLPGSRPNEIRRHLPVFRAALRLLPRELCAVVATTPESAELVRELAPELPQTRTAIALGGADAAICASGTATLELALAGVPGVVVYRLSTISYHVARRVVTVPFIALPNLVLGEPLLPELIQDRLQPRALADALLRLLEPAERARIGEGMERVRAALGQPGYASRVADLAEELLGR